MHAVNFLANATGAEGKVDESLEAMKEVEDIKHRKKVLEDEYHAMIPRHAAQQQKLRACEVCGAFLSMYDNDRRLADHFGGKLHIGFVTIREKIKQLEEMIAKKMEQRRKEREEYIRERAAEMEKRKKSRCVFMGAIGACEMPKKLLVSVSLKGGAPGHSPSCCYIFL